MARTGRDDQRQWVLGVLEEYEVPLSRFAARLLGDQDAARDVVQHVFLRLCAEPMEPLQGRVAQWLFAVCRNRAIDVLRKRNNAPTCEEAGVADCPGREPDPALTAERAELYRSINGLVQQLPLPQREAIGLWCEGFSYRQIADVVSTSEGNVRVVVHRALKRIRQHPVAQQLLDQVPSPSGRGG